MTCDTSMLKVHSNGSLRGLPVYPESPDLTGLTAVVTGANGITGSAMVRVLAEAPRRWKKIYCLSRRPPSEYTLKSLGEETASRIEHISCDFLSEPQELAATLKRSIRHMYVPQSCASFHHPHAYPWRGRKANIDSRTEIMYSSFYTCSHAQTRVARRGSGQMPKS